MAVNLVNFAPENAVFGITFGPRYAYPSIQMLGSVYRCLQENRTPYLNVHSALCTLTCPPVVIKRDLFVTGDFAVYSLLEIPSDLRDKILEVVRTCQTRRSTVDISDEELAEIFGFGSEESPTISSL